MAVLTENYADLAQQFSVASLALFGSYARDEQTPQSDVDLLVTFSKPVGFGFMHLAHRLKPCSASVSISSPPMASSPTVATPSSPR